MDSENPAAPLVSAPGSAAPFLVYLAAFHLVWIAWPWVVYPKLTATFDQATLAYAVIQLGMRILAWLAPVWFYLRYVDRVDPFESSMTRGACRSTGVCCRCLSSATQSCSYALLPVREPSGRLPDARERIVPSLAEAR